jgi:hypothetical protein
MLRQLNSYIEDSIATSAFLHILRTTEHDCTHSSIYTLTALKILLFSKVEVTRLGQLSNGESTKLSLSAVTTARTASSTPVAASSGSSAGNMYDSNDTSITASTDAAVDGSVIKDTDVDSSVDAVTGDATANIGQPLEVCTHQLTDHTTIKLYRVVVLVHCIVLACSHTLLHCTSKMYIIMYTG